MVEITKDLIRAYALKNAIEHDGTAVMGSVLSPLFHEGLEKSEIKKYMPRIKEVIDEINEMDLSAQKRAFELSEGLISRRSERDGLQELPNAEKGKVITRFAPSPSGPMHIGHAATGMPSALYAEDYEGKFIIRIEDTNPDNIFEPAYEMIKEEVKWLFGNVHRVLIQSERMEHYYKYAQKLIDKQKAYICTCDPELFRELIKDSKACPCRDLSVDEQKGRWEKMLDKKGFKQGEVVLRFKSNLGDKNPALRDFPLARINTSKHPKQGNTYRVWPLMNLSVFVDDVETGVTHAIRAKEHQDNAKRQEMMFEVFGKTPPETLFLGRYNFTDLQISASKTREKIEEGEFQGWDDIRLPFIAALKKRGFTPESFKQMAIERGVSGVDKNLTHDEYFELLGNINREYIRDDAITLEYESDADEPNMKLKMPTGEVKELMITDTLINDKVYFLKGIGYARYNEPEKELWFSHK